MQGSILVSGTHQGLGHFLCKRFQADGYTRQTTKSEYTDSLNSDYQLVIHCAFNSRPPDGPKKIDAYLQENLDLTKRLMQVPHQRFVFISSVDVYPKDGQRHDESSNLIPDNCESPYGVSKLMCEKLVTENATQPLILRCSSLLGAGMRANSLVRIVEESPCSLTLSSESTFNYVLYETVSDFIKLAQNSDLSGIYNLVSNTSVTLEEIRTFLNRKNIQFGEYLYDVGNVSSSKASKIEPSLERSSLKTIEEFLKTRGDKL
ncbi:MAG: SDR family oxidoreductase [Candidatus Lindowbacteria bacterium]|nr:SDR family oxidoreductase [Candidatus Lindowbacteria bacterium]